MSSNSYYVQQGLIEVKRYGRRDRRLILPELTSSDLLSDLLSNFQFPQGLAEGDYELTFTVSFTVPSEGESEEED